MKKPTVFLLASVSLLAGLFSSCVPIGPSAQLAAYHAYDRPTKKPTNPSAVKVKVSLSTQRVYVMEGNTPLLVMPVSTGASNAPTPSGSFTIFNKEQKHRANTHGYAYSGKNAVKTSIGSKPAGWAFKGTPMPYWCEFKPNYGFHTGWVKHGPCSHGCIRMHENLAPKFFQLVRVGTPVNISRTQPEDATLGNIPLPPDAGPLPDYAPQFYVTDGYFSAHKTPQYQ